MKSNRRWMRLLAWQGVLIEVLYRLIPHSLDWEILEMSCI